jgi:WD40 repeat protein
MRSPLQLLLLALVGALAGYAPPAPGQVRTVLTPNLPARSSAWFSYLAYSPDGKWLAAASNRRVVVWDAQTGKERTAVARDVVLHQDHFGFTPDSKQIICAGYSSSGTVLLDAATGLPRGSIKEAGYPIVPRQGDALALLDSGNCTVTLYGLTSLRRQAVWKVSKKYVRRAAFSPDGRLLATCSHEEAADGKCVRVWDVAGGAEVAHSAFRLREPTCLAWARTARRWQWAAWCLARARAWPCAGPTSCASSGRSRPTAPPGRRSSRPTGRWWRKPTTTVPTAGSGTWRAASCACG